MSDERSSIAERLSTGFRINRASDDPAGLSVAQELQANGRLYTQAIRNVNDGISALNMADAALESLTDIIHRQMELAEQAANGTFTFQQRKSINAEANALVDEFNRIIEGTKFNGRSLLENPNEEIVLHVGINASDTLTTTTSETFSRTVGTGDFTEIASLDTATYSTVTLGDVNNDGNLDIVGATTGSDANVFLGKGDNTFQAVQTFTTGAGTAGAQRSVVIDDFTGDGVMDLAVTDVGANTLSLLVGNGNGTFQARSTTASASIQQADSIDYDGDGDRDLVISRAGGAGVFLYNNNGNGNFTESITLLTGTYYDVTVGDFNRDGKEDIVANSFSNTRVLLGNGDGSFEIANVFTQPGWTVNSEIGDLDNDGYDDLIVAHYIGATGTSFRSYLNDGTGHFSESGTFSTLTAALQPSIGDLNNDGLNDVVIGAQATPGISTHLGNGDGSFKNEVSLGDTGGPWEVATGDFNNDGILEIVSAGRLGGNMRVYGAVTGESVYERALNLYDAESAQGELDYLRSELERTTNARSSIGATLSRLQFTRNTLESTQVETEEAYSRIADADVAKEAAELVRLEILQQSVTRILQLSNVQNRRILDLL